MDKALKQRLVGAIVLIILAVIVLPMLLSGRSETLKQESREIEVPARPDELSLETRRFPVGVPNQPEPEVQQQEQAASEQDVATVDTGEPAQAVEPEDGQPAEADDSGPGPAVEAPAVVATITVPTTGDTPISEQVAADDNDAPRYLVQVASFSSEKRANALAQRLRDQGLPVAMDVVDRAAGRLHRVRVGPYARRGDADALVASLREDNDGLAPRVLDLRPDDSAPVTTPSDPLVRWVVQVGSFSEKERADALVAELRTAGLSAFSEQVTSAAGTAYKVRIGPEISRERAVELAQQVKQGHGLNGFVTTSE